MKKYICKYCGKQLNNGQILGGHLTNCKMNPKYNQIVKKRIKSVKSITIKKAPIKSYYKFNCQKCGKQYTVELTQNDFKKGNYKKNCSRICANSRNWTQQDKLKKSISAKNSEKVKKCNKLKIKKQLIKICKYCGKQFKTKRDNKEFCNNTCYIQYQHTNQYKNQMSVINKKAYANGNNYVAGGTSKWIQMDTSIGKFKVQGTYQVRMCKILDKMKQLKVIKDWQYTTDKFQYMAEDNKQHTYLLDFKVYNNDGGFKYIETKGYQRQRDSYKWNAVRQKGFQLQVCFDQQIKQYQKKYNL